MLTSPAPTRSTRAVRSVGGRGLLALVSAALLMFVASCGSDAGDTAAPTPTGGDDAATSGFPITLEQMTGEVTIDERPTRVVTLGYTDTDIANALGAEIVLAVASPFGTDGLNPPWAPTELSADVATLDPMSPNIEAIAAADPDVILATAAYPATIDMYDQLSQIAPVVTPITGPLLDSGDDLTRVIGTALGQQDEAEALIARSTEQIERFRDEHSDLAGHTAVFAPREGTRTALFVEPEAASVALLEQVGLSTPASLRTLPGDRTFGATFISDEQLDLLDEADIAIVGLYTEASSEQFLGLPTVSNLDVATNGSMIPIDQPLGAALQSPSPVSTPYLIAELGPLLVAAGR